MIAVTYCHNLRNDPHNHSWKYQCTIFRVADMVRCTRERFSYQCGVVWNAAIQAGGRHAAIHSRRMPVHSVSPHFENLDLISPSLSSLSSLSPSLSIMLKEWQKEAKSLVDFWTSDISQAGYTQLNSTLFHHRSQSTLLDLPRGKCDYAFFSNQGSLVTTSPHKTLHLHIEEWYI